MSAPQKMQPQWERLNDHTHICLTDAGHVARNHDHFVYKQNITICSDGTVCPNNDFSSSNESCCEEHQGRNEIDYHNNGTMPVAASDLPDYYSSAGYTVPTDGVYQSATYSTYTATTRSTPPPKTAITSGASTVTTIRTYTPTLTPISISTPTPAPDSSSGLGSGAKAGIGIGMAIAAGALVIAGLAIYFWMRRRKTHSKRSPTQLAPGKNNGYEGMPIQEHEAVPMYGGVMGELPAGSKRPELDSQPRTELDSQPRTELDSQPEPKVKTHEMQR
ncbi:MAG: hypothetical protein Q9188_005934 [Gyalolechia gomerana]